MFQLFVVTWRTIVLRLGGAKPGL